MAHGGGRPKAKIPWEIVESMCKISCTQQDICDALKIDDKTLAKHIKSEYGLTFKQYFREKSVGGKTSLRRKIWQKALEGKGDNEMIKMLAKKYLAMGDNSEHEITVEQKPSEVTVVWKEIKGKESGESFMDEHNRELKGAD
jgi:hypothetical protein